MAKTWVLSDHHFSHKNIIRFDERPFYSVDEMNAFMVQAHNDLVSPDDTVYFLGDFSFNQKLAAEQIKSLNGKKVLVTGNHDDLRNKAFVEAFDEVHSYLKRKLFGHEVVMFHYPIAEWDKMHFGSVHLHGHVHGKDMDICGRIYDVWAGGNGYAPYDMEFLLTKVAEKPVREHGHG
jgi:calcineurin-like phosphoesterase family protein